MTLIELWDTIQRGGLPFVLFLILALGSKQVWVWGYLYRAVCRERDEWKGLALAGTSLAKRATKKAEVANEGGGEVG